MFENYCKPALVHGLCDFCGQSRLTEVARSKVVPPVMNEKGNWIDGYSKEKADRSREGYRKATEELSQSCLKFQSHEDDGQVCKACLEEFIKQFGV